jgi:uncharacterized protein YkwD
MRRAILLTSVAVFAIAAVPAHGGSSVSASKLPTCKNSYLLFGTGTSRTAWRTAFLCLLNGVRKAEHLPALKESGLLDGIGQLQSDKFERTGSASHGKSLTEIGQRMSRRGYHPAAYNEAFGVVDQNPSPYGALYAMVKAHGVPCEQLFDPRFRDVGIGVSAGDFVGTTALEFGLRAGSKQPSTNTGPMSTCGHRIPTPLVSGAELQPRHGPVVSDTTISISVRCTARVTCKFTGTVKLSHNGASVRQELTIAAGKEPKLTFTFDADSLSDELKNKRPSIRFSVDVTAPAQYKDHFDAPIEAGTAR